MYAVEWSLAYGYVAITIASFQNIFITSNACSQVAPTHSVAFCIWFLLVYFQGPPCAPHFLLTAVLFIF